MAVNAPNPGSFLGQISQAVVNIRNDFQTLVNLNNYITAMGGETFLTTAFPNGIGLTAPDAAVVISALGNLNNVATGYNGGAPAPQLNYQANSQPLWGGQ